MSSGSSVLERLRAGHSASVPAMAVHLGVHPNTLWKKIREGKIAAVDVGGMKRIPNHEGRRLAGLPSGEPIAA